MAREVKDLKVSRIIADCPSEAYRHIKIACAERGVPIGHIVKLAVVAYLELNIDPKDLGVYDDEEEEM